ncbi:hypothetical protein [Paenibacillus sp. H1-7]|uniref:hypothetical protein n=1 Tax=Paenibacillus sp. H1-7 TaxID=2282849 RepID=UPI001EF9A354|nr:hypothetical protein [Paenibacillus sp. H1-7]
MGTRTSTAQTITPGTEATVLTLTGVPTTASANQVKVDAEFQVNVTGLVAVGFNVIARLYRDFGGPNQLLLAEQVNSGVVEIITAIVIPAIVSGDVTAVDNLAALAPITESYTLRIQVDLLVAVAATVTVTNRAINVVVGSVAPA